MPVEDIEYEDSLRKGTDKLNNSINQSNQAIEKSDQAVTTANNAKESAGQAVETANTALGNSESTQDQLDTIVIESGTSDAEVLQARTNNRGKTFGVLRDYLNALDIEFKQRAINPKWYDASGSDKTTTGNIDAGSSSLTVTDLLDFKKGQGIAVKGAGTNGELLVSTVNSIDSATGIVTLADVAGTTVAGAIVQHDDTSAIQRAFEDAANASVGVYLPDGKYRITSPVSFTKVPFSGNGTNSIIYTHHCTAFQIGTDGSAKQVPIGNFVIQGIENSNGNIGIKFTGDTATKSNISYGYNFSNITVLYLDTAFSCLTLWHSTFKDCQSLGCYNGILLNGQCVENVIDHFIYDGAHPNTPASSSFTNKKTGISADGYNYSLDGYLRPESLKILTPYIAAADYGIFWRDCFVGIIKDVDIDYNSYMGIYVNNYDGGLTIASGSINCTTGALNGIAIVDQAAPLNSQLNVSDIYIGAWADTDLTGVSSALKIGRNVTKVNVDRMKIGGGSGYKFYRGVWLDHCDEIALNRVIIDDDSFSNQAMRGDYATNVGMIDCSHPLSNSTNTTLTKFESKILPNRGLAAAYTKTIDTSTWDANTFYNIIPIDTLESAAVYLVLLSFSSSSSPYFVTQTLLLPVALSNNSKSAAINSNSVNNQNDGNVFSLQIPASGAGNIASGLDASLPIATSGTLTVTATPLLINSLN